ncbi:hypothetical protein GCM10010398_48790 [Streptomyces fimbriatus]
MLLAPALWAPYEPLPREPANDPGVWAPYEPVLRGMFPKAVKPSSSSPLRSPGSARKDLTYSV